MANYELDYKLSNVQLFGLVLLGYDYCLTFPQEVERIWKRKFTGPILLFLLNRYLGLAYQMICIILVVSGQLNKTVTLLPGFKTVAILAPSPIQNFKEATAIFLVVVCELIMAIRVYALYNCNRILLGFLLTLIAAQIALTICFDYVNAAAGVLNRMLRHGDLNGLTTNSFALWTTALIIDSSIFVLTLRKTYRFFKSSRSAPLLHLFLRDGIVYFFVIGTSNVLNILLNFVVPSPPFPESKMSSQICTSITSLLVSRLVLNIRTKSDPDSTENQRSISDFLIGNLGGDMDALFDEDIEEVRDQRS